MEPARFLVLACLFVLATSRTEPGRGVDDDPRLRSREQIDTSKLVDIQKQVRDPRFFTNTRMFSQATLA